MADNNERKNVDELLSLLNELHEEPKKDVPDDIDETEYTEPTLKYGETPKHREHTEESVKYNAPTNVGSQVDELLDILSRPPAPKEEEEEEELNPEIPVAIFDHLSHEGQTLEAETEGDNHFSDSFDPELAEKAQEEEEIVTEEVVERISIFNRIGSAIAGTSFLPKAVLYVLMVVIIATYLSYFIISIGNDVFALVTDSQEITVTIPEEGATHEEVAKILEENGIIQYAWVYELYMEYRGSDVPYIPGDTTLNTDYNYTQIITALTIGETTREIVTVTIPEGSTVEDIITILTEAGVGQREDYVEVINNYPYKWEFVQQLDEMGYSEDRIYRLEGYLYPDTYDFYNDEDEIYVINKMLNAFSDKFWEDFSEVNKDGTSLQIQAMETYGMTFDEVITLASMLQSEGGTTEDFAYISKVFHNRLVSEDYPNLESDATTQYVLPERVGPSSAELTRYDSPYNTYITEGLPPGAIGNPGYKALMAAINPVPPKNEAGGDMEAYFFVSNNMGKTYYAQTISGHQKNIDQVAIDNAAIEAGTYEG